MNIEQVLSHFCEQIPQTATIMSVFKVSMTREQGAMLTRVLEKKNETNLGSDSGSSMKYDRPEFQVNPNGADLVTIMLKT